MKLLRFIRPSLGLCLIVLGLATPVYAGAPLPGVPEVDPASLTGALALLSGGLLMITDRLGRK
jgi:hypothetical protein